MVGAESLIDEVNIKRAQKNVSWKSVLNLLFVYRYTIVDWPAGIPAVGASFNVKSLNADELQDFTVPFLKKQMDAAYCAKEDNEGAGVVPLPKSSLLLKDWTTGELSWIWTDGKSNWDD